MKNKILLIILLFLLTGKVFSQLTLTSAYKPVIGDVLQETICDTTGIIKGGLGANQTWSYMNLNSMGTINLNWINPASTPYFSQFQTSNVASTFDNNTSYIYYSTSSSNYVLLGYGNPNLVIPYTNPELFMKYPFSYDSTFNDDFSADFSNGGIPTHRTGNIYVSGDAWGTIHLPVGTFTNTLRVNSFSQTSDKVIVYGDTTFYILFTDTYDWYAPGKKYPVFEISYTYTYINNLQVTSNKNVIYTPNSPSIGIRNISSEVPGEFKLYQNYPNPFNPSTNIRYAIPKNSFVKLIVFDMLGREIETLVNEKQSAGTYEAKFNASQYSSGAYFYKLNTDGFSETKKMVLMK